MEKHVTVLISPQGEEFYEAYGPMTKDRSQALQFFTNPQTLRAPSRFGRNGEAFWDSERRAEKIAQKEYDGWTYRHEPVENALFCNA